MPSIAAAKGLTLLRLASIKAVPFISVTIDTVRVRSAVTKADPVISVAKIAFIDNPAVTVAEQSIDTSNCFV